MSRKREITNLVASSPQSTLAIAKALGIKGRTASVAVAKVRGLGLIKPVATEPRAGRQPVIVWGPV